MTDLVAASQSPGLLFAYAALLIVALIASVILGGRFRAAGRKQRVDDPDVLALLAKDAQRLADVVITRMLVNGAIDVHGGKLAVMDRSKAVGPVETAIAGLTSPMRWQAASGAIKDYAEHKMRRMTDQGLLAKPQELHRRRMAQVAPLLLLAAPAALLWLIAWANGHSALPLAVLLALTGLAIIVRWSGTDRRTTGGIDTLHAASERHDRLERGAPRDELVMGVALFGTGILAGSAFDAYYKMRATSDSSGGDSGSSDSGDSGGGCGGGCS